MEQDATDRGSLKKTLETTARQLSKGSLNKIGYIYKEYAPLRQVKEKKIQIQLLPSAA